MADLLEFFHVVPNAIACDQHPDYASTRHAQQLAAGWNVPLLPVQHHHAHVAAVMAEHGLPGPALGFSWDGTGHGLDGTVWGGEVLWCDVATFHRVAHLRTFRLPGGDVAMRQPRRSALGVLFELFGPSARQHATAWFTLRELDTLVSMLVRQINVPRTSSMGRLFDAVAAICGLPPVISFEGQAAMALEFAADENEQSAYCFDISPASSPGQAMVIDWEPVIREVLSDRIAGIPVGRISAKFHNAVAEMAAEIARHVTKDTPAGSAPCALSGGCFQNGLLSMGVSSRLAAGGFSVYTHHQVPPGDGGIALGQAMVALGQLLGSHNVSRSSG